MALKHVQKTYDALGAEDPLYAVLSFPEAKGNRWDPAVFFARGKAEIDAVMAALGKRNPPLPVNYGRALDFGCGVGRLTQALAEHFDAVDGVDISASMVRNARQYNQYGERCHYHVNTVDDLSLFPDSTFDFIYSNITLQHIPPEASRSYIAEFMRVLKTRGVALFQVPDGPLIEAGSVAEAWYRFRSGTLRRAWKRLRGRAPVEIHHIHHATVEALVTGAGGELLDSWQEGSVRRKRVSRFYLASRDDLKH